MDLQLRSIFDNSMRQRWLYFCYRFDVSVVNLLTLSITYVGCHSVFVDDFEDYSYSVFTGDLWISRDKKIFDKSMRQPWLFLLLIWCVCCEFIDAFDYISRLSLSINWWFQGLQLLCFRWWFMNLQWHSIFDNSMRQPWLYFCYRFDASVGNLFTPSIPYVRCHSFFSDDFNVYRDSFR